MTKNAPGKVITSCPACKSTNIFRDAAINENTGEVSAHDSMNCGDCDYDGHEWVRTPQETPLYTVHTDRANEPLPLEQAFKQAGRYVALPNAARLAECKAELEAKGFTSWGYGFTSVQIHAVKPAAVAPEMSL